ncbi:MAG: hypothetical protein ACYDBQ_00480 [Thermoplasmatota archaeon]
MTPTRRGELVWEYLPPRAHPMLYAGLILASAVFLLGATENLLRDNQARLYEIYAAPPAAVALLMALLWPSPVRFYRNGIAPSRPLVARWWRPFVAFGDVAAVYPVHYDVTGAFVSPFASSDGKVTQTGVGLETVGGSLSVLRFTPTRFSRSRAPSRGYREAWPLARSLYQEATGRPPVSTAPRLSAEERSRLEGEARRPFLPFFAIVALFACAAPLLWILVNPLHLPLAWALPASLLPPVATSLRSWWASRRRNRILNALSKSALA